MNSSPRDKLCIELEVPLICRSTASQRDGLVRTRNREPAISHPRLTRDERAPGQGRSRRCDLILRASQRTSRIGILAYNNLRARIALCRRVLPGRARQFARVRSIGSSGRVQSHSRAAARYVSSLASAYPRSLAEGGG